ncbi:ABC transporter permease [Siminovitchia sp. FSL H7-0308]|uniref:ABC transporter permease n=1 Tax=Siminovitchia sp. FSL H7-0308 TaxID=2921432 RepID=UPI0030EBA456
MSNSYQLFLQRLKLDLLNLYKVYRVIVDWTIALYIIIPGLVIGIAFYMEWWSELPYVLQTLTFNKLLIITFLTFFLNDIKIFIYSTDQLFLIQNIKLLKKITLYGLIYSLFVTFLTSIIIFIILLPILVNKFHLTIQFIIYFYFYYLSSNVLFLIIRKKIKIYCESFLFYILFYILSLTLYFILWDYFLSSFYIMISVISIYIIFTIIFSKKILFSGVKFTKLVSLDEIIRNKWIRLVLWQGGHTKLLNSQGTYRPWILKSSKLIFKQRTVPNILTDAFIKTFLRDKSSILTFFQLMVLFITALFLVSNFWTRFIIWGFAIYMILDIFKNNWLAFRFSSFISMFRWDYNDLIISLKKSMYILSFPFIFIIGGIFGYLNFNPLGIITFSFISIVLSILKIKYNIRNLNKNYKIT